MIHRGVVIVDRDGVINELVSRAGRGPREAPLAARDVRLVEGAATQLKRLRSRGWLLACVTNQPGAAKGECSIEDLMEVHRTILDLLGAGGVVFDSDRMCCHHPDGLVGDPLTGPCECRKPAPGMLLAVLEELGSTAPRSWMIGDTDADVSAGKAAGSRTILVANPDSAHKQGSTEPEHRVVDLASAVNIILGCPDVD